MPKVSELQRALAWSLSIDHGKRVGIDPRIIFRIIQRESMFNPDAHNKKEDARGLMQMRMAAAKDVGANHDELFDPEKGVRAGTDYLAKQLKDFNGDISKAVSAFNAGRGTVLNKGIINKSYVDFVMQDVRADV